MNRRHFLRASALPLLAPVLPSIFEPLRMYAQESKKSDALTITKIEPYLMRIPSPAGGRGGGAGREGGAPGRGTGAGGVGAGRAFPCVRIETAEGIHGWGEGTTPPTNPAVLTQIRESGKLLMGKSAWDIEGHWVQMYTTEFNTLGGTLFAAMSAIDVALWDIVGKKLGVPVYKLLGGRAIPARTSLRIYASEPWGGLPKTRAAYRERTKELIAKGATGGKTDFFGGTPLDRELTSQNLYDAREMIAGVREASPTFDICVEAHAKFNMHSAGRIVKMVEPFDVFFLEEPVPPEDIEAMALLQHQTNVPIATGESLQSHYNFREILEKRAARVLQPDVARTGGLTPVKKIAAMAETHYVNLAPHNPNGPLCTAASLHLCTSIANFLIIEQGNTNTEIYKDIFTGGWKDSLSEMWVPEGPGIGVDFSPAFVKEYGTPA
ncbi:MAG TPA: mandelate racemase/muconate lactonizing enzyme family protein [Vicinamibacterales bacterium]|nr:mandelate racemase/muconate lactonizing enzyme family protein [Vicinamibacterales bacterium]